jgi:molecular chaperone IbpA
MSRIDFPHPFANVGRDFDKFFVGFDDQFNRLSKLHQEVSKNVQNFPPYNIKKVDENKYVIEMAVVGFHKSEIEITFEDDRLIIKGSSKEEPSDTYLFKGISMRDFTRVFALDEHIEVKNANFLNGMLRIVLERIVPEHKKARKINIEDEASSVSEFAQNNPMLLTEQELQHTENKLM